MCDYSLEMYKSRQAAVGDQLSIQALPEGTGAMVTMIGAPKAETIGEVIAPAARELEIVRS